MFANPTNNPQCVPGEGYPSVFVVDTHATQRPIPPRLKQGGRSVGPAQTLLFLLVSLALSGMVIEACFIYRLYKVESASEASLSKLTANAASPTKNPSQDVLPSKPVAHLTDGQDAHHDKYYNIMGWSKNSDPLLYKMSYHDGKLIILEEGYYYVYSKIFFQDNGLFHHFIKLQTERYAGGYLTILQSRTFSPHSMTTKSNSYLGGVFRLYKNDALCVRVTNTSKIVRSAPFENIFGAFMI